MCWNFICYLVGFVNRLMSNIFIWLTISILLNLYSEIMTLSDEEIKRLFRIRKTVMQMLRDRGYLVVDFEINMSKEQFISKYGENMKREDLVISKAMRNNSGDQVSIWLFSLSIFYDCFKLPDVYQWYCHSWSGTKYLTQAHSSHKG